MLEYRIQTFSPGRLAAITLRAARRFGVDPDEVSEHAEALEWYGRELTGLALEDYCLSRPDAYEASVDPESGGLRFRTR
jgi:hypothetical protein